MMDYSTFSTNTLYVLAEQQPLNEGIKKELAQRQAWHRDTGTMELFPATTEAPAPIAETSEARS